MNATGEKTVRDLLAKGRNAQFVADATGWPYAQVVAMAEKMRAEAAVAETADPPADLAAMRQAARDAVEPRAEVKARIASATELLVRADAVEDRKVQSALSRARKAMTDLAAAMADYTDKAEARPTVDRLEQELRDAKAALRRRPANPAKRTAPAPAATVVDVVGRSTVREGLRPDPRAARPVSTRGDLPGRCGGCVMTGALSGVIA